MDSSSQPYVPGALFNQQRNKENNAPAETENNMYRFPVTVMTDYRYHSPSPFYGAGCGNSSATNNGYTSDYTDRSLLSPPLYNNNSQSQSQGSQSWAQQRQTFDRVMARSMQQEEENELVSDLSDEESEIVDSSSATVSEKREKKKKVPPQKSAPKDVDWSTEDVKRLINLWR